MVKSFTTCKPPVSAFSFLKHICDRYLRHCETNIRAHISASPHLREHVKHKLVVI